MHVANILEVSGIPTHLLHVGFQDYFSSMNPRQDAFSPGDGCRQQDVHLLPVSSGFQGLPDVHLVLGLKPDTHQGLLDFIDADRVVIDSAPHFFPQLELSLDTGQDRQELIQVLLQAFEGPATAAVRLDKDHDGFARRLKVRIVVSGQARVVVFALVETTTFAVRHRCDHVVIFVSQLFRPENQVFVRAKLLLGFTQQTSGSKTRNQNKCNNYTLNNKNYNQVKFKFIGIS